MRRRKIKKGGRIFLQQQKNQKEIPHFDLIHGVLGALIIISITLSICEVFIYRKTFIHFKIPFCIWIFMGLISSFFLKKVFIVYFDLRYLFLRLLYNIITCGGLMVTVFMWINYNFADKTTFIENEKIISTGHLSRGLKGSCNQPYIIINYQEFEKQLVYNCGADIELYKSVDLTIARGFLGFDVIVQSDLKKY
ncbi:hypothetical protein ACI6Q2_10320 [Chitinophagaceae bacterium LWZ2-11]